MAKRRKSNESNNNHGDNLFNSSRYLLDKCKGEKIMTHNREEMIHDLKAIDAGFMEESGGSSPVCLSYAVYAIRKLTAYEKAVEEIKKMPISGEYALGVCDCLEIIVKHLEKAFQGE